MKKNSTYYLVRKTMVAKREECGNQYEDFLFIKGRWVPDKDHVIMDHLVGYDPCEPKDSPYRIGSTSVLSEMKEISEKKAIAIMKPQILSSMKELWKNKFKNEKTEWDKNPKWPAKLVKTEFKLHGIRYTIYPSDIGLSTDPWDQGFMESIQSDIEKDLKEYGATDIFSCGFLD